MSAYNQLRGAYCSENDYLLNRVLKGAWGFDGVVISDWGATHSMLGSARYGIDLEMNGTAMYEDYFLGRPFLEAVKSGQIKAEMLDAKVRRILRVMIRLGLLNSQRPRGSLNTLEHQAVALRTAEESIVLLKNEGRL